MSTCTVFSSLFNVFNVCVTCIIFFCRVFDRKEFFRQNYDSELFAFKNRLGLTFQDESILRTALTHASYKEENTVYDGGATNGKTFKNKEKSLHASEDNGKLSLIG